MIMVVVTVMVTVMVAPACPRRCYVSIIDIDMGLAHTWELLCYQPTHNTQCARRQHNME